MQSRVPARDSMPPTHSLGVLASLKGGQLAGTPVLLVPRPRGAERNIPVLPAVLIWGSLLRQLLCCPDQYTVWNMTITFLTLKTHVCEGSKQKPASSMLPLHAPKSVGDRPLSPVWEAPRKKKKRTSQFKVQSVFLVATEMARHPGGHI